MVHTSVNIILEVVGHQEHGDGYRSLIFKRPAGFVYEPGDWIDIEPLSGSLSGGKTYSLSSSPTEPELKITYREGLSERKRLLASAEPGHTLRVVQYGNDYNFRLHPHRAAVLIAGGVGIAPFRSMLKELHDTGITATTSLLYLNKTANFLFKHELDSWVAEHQNLNVQYFITQGQNKKAKTAFIMKSVTKMQQGFYISGPEGMVESTEHLLIDHGVSVADIKIDSFGGY